MYGKDLLKVQGKYFSCAEDWKDSLLDQAPNCRSGAQLPRHDAMLTERFRCLFQYVLVSFC